MMCDKCKREVTNKQLVCNDCNYQIVKRGNVYLAKLNEGVCGVLVLQNDKGNRYSPTTQVIKVVNEKPDFYSLQTIDKSRLIKKIYNYNYKKIDAICLNLSKIIFGNDYFENIGTA